MVSIGFICFLSFCLSFYPRPCCLALLIMDNGAEGISEVLGPASDLAAGVEFWDLSQSCNGGENSLGTFNREHF